MISALRQFLARSERLFILTGAGCSTASGIPDYRDEDGAWKRARPVLFGAFMADPYTRRRYWARSMAGWDRFNRAQPNDTHRALAQLEREDRVEALVTQNVDRLHQAAGSHDVIDLHGRLDFVRCMSCGHRLLREVLQAELVRCNPDWAALDARVAPDGDADLEARDSLGAHAPRPSGAALPGVIKDFSSFHVPACPACAGILKPDVVFFGESVPAERVSTAMTGLAHADAVLVVGTSLMVYSGYRFVQAAAHSGKPIAAINLGRTRADPLLTLKVTDSCTAALAFLLPAPSATERAGALATG
jgi:NAD-dependent SIR2 family protein deacetylase